MPLLMNSCVAAAAYSTSQVTMPTFAPAWISCAAQDFCFFSWWLQTLITKLGSTAAPMTIVGPLELLPAALVAPSVARAATAASASTTTIPNLVLLMCPPRKRESRGPYAWSVRGFNALRFSVAACGVRSRAWSGFEAVRRGRDRQRDQLARRRGVARKGGLARLRARAERLARRRDPDGRDHRAGRRARGVRVVASALHRLGGVRGAEAGARRARGRVPEHGRADRDPVPGWRERLPDHVARAERRCARTGVGAHRRGVHAERRPCLRRALDRAVVAGRIEARGEGAPEAWPPRFRRVRRQRAL